MTTSIILWLLFGLFLKHFIVDFPMQQKWQYKNKGVYGHPGGLYHAGSHGIATFLVLLMFPMVSLSMACLLALFDAVAHYHIDWTKTNINQKMGWGPTTHEAFWILIGVDQFMHAVTYLAIAAILI